MQTNAGKGLTNEQIILINLTVSTINLSELRYRNISFDLKTILNYGSGDHN